MDNSAKWITNYDFSILTPVNVFGKELACKSTGINDTGIPENSDKHILFRKKFSIEDTSNVNIEISADDYYKLYINGCFVTSGPAPGYPWHYYYNKINISKYLVKGENLIAVHTYYQGVRNRVWVSGDNRHGLICQVISDKGVIFASDESFICAYHTGYLSAPVNVARHNTSFCEYYDSQAPEVGFETTYFDDSSWANCVVNHNAEYNIFLQQTQQLVYNEIKPESVNKTNEGYTFDIGREIVGYVNIRATGNKGDVVLIHFGEEMTDDNTVMFNTRSGCLYEDKWILSGGANSFEPFDYKGFRYVEIISDATIEDIKIIARHYPFTPAVTCPVNDVDIKRVWTLCEDTIKYGVQESFIDCPTREKGQYLGDVCISAVSQAIFTKNSEMLKKAIVDFAQSSRICDGLMAVSTCSKMQEIADYSLIFTMALLWYYKFTNDVELLISMKPVLDKLTSYFAKYERYDGLLENVTEKWNLVDWPQNLRDNYDFPLTLPIGKGAHNVLNAFYIGMLKSVNKINDILGIEKVDTNRYEKSFIKEFYDSDTHLFKDCFSSNHHSIHSNVLPLLFDIGINDLVKSNIISLIASKGITNSGTYFSFFILQALKNAGERKMVLNLIKDKRAWLNMLSQGATTTFETWGKDQKKNCSLCHPWSCAPILILYDM